MGQDGGIQTLELQVIKTYLSAGGASRDEEDGICQLYRDCQNVAQAT